MKKALSALLSVLLLLGCMNCLFFGTAVSAATVTRNYDFEGLTTADLAGLVQTSNNCSVAIDENNVFKSGNALKVTLPSKQNEVGSISFPGIQFTAGHTYKISLRVVAQAAAVPVAGDAYYVYVGLHSEALKAEDIPKLTRWRDANGAEAEGGAYVLTSSNGDNKLGTRYNVSGTVMATKTGALTLSSCVAKDTAASLYLDNLVVEETADDTNLGTATNYDFENVADLAGLVQTSNNCSVAIDENNVFKSGNALKVTLPSKQNEVGSISFPGIQFTAGHTYKISLRVVAQAAAVPVAGDAYYVYVGLHSEALKAEDIPKLTRWRDANGAEAEGGAYVLTSSNGDNKLGTRYNVSGTVMATKTGALTLSSCVAKDTAASLYLDNLVVEEQISSAAIENAVASEFEFKGTSIRTTGTQALRFKTQVNKAALEADYSGYKITEYGFLVFRKDYMEENAELTVDTAKTDSVTGKTVKALQKAAYVKGKTDVVFDETNTEKLFTAALFNIKAENYNVGYAVRTYAVLEGPYNTKLTVYVTDTQSYSVNETAKLAFEKMGNAYTDVDSYSWAEDYETRSYLYENILSKIDGGNYTAPAQPAV